MIDRVAAITECIERSFDTDQLLVKDQSHLHAGHAGAASGMGHFAVTVVSSAFAGLSTIKRHRMIYDAVGELMKTDIHALSIEARAPNETTG